MSPALHIIASCADRKRLPVAPRLQLRAHRGRVVEGRFGGWWRELEKPGREQSRADDLYAGPYWFAVRSIQEELGADVVRLWIASAGYGLVPQNAQVSAYSATFAARQADSVCLEPTQRKVWQRAWWRLLAGVAGPAPGHPRTIADVARLAGGASVIVLGSPAYVEALEDDLGAAAAVAGDRLLVISGTPGPLAPAVQEHWLPSTAALLPEVGGALPSLHARVAAHIAREVTTRGRGLDSLRTQWTSLAMRSAKPMPKRTPATDAEVMQYIRAALAQDPKARYTRLLRGFREGERACEQARFRNLFLAVAEERKK